MPFNKILLIILMARVLGVTHIVESGRMGGMQLTHYHRFGFSLVSIEMFPVGHVQRSLQDLIPGIEMLNGDGKELLPRAVAKIRRTSPPARILAIVDGPKGNGAKDLARSLVNETEMIVIDDFPVASLEVPKQRAFRDAWPYATTCTLNKAWSDSFPRSRDRAALAAAGSFFDYDVRAYLKDGEFESTLLLGRP